VSKTGSRVLGIISIALSICSAAAAVYYIVGTDRPKHAPLFAVVFIALLVYGMISLRAKGKTAASA